MVKDYKELKVEKDGKGRNVIRGPGKISGKDLFELTKRNMGDIKVHLPFTATGFRCTKNQELASKCLGCTVTAPDANTIAPVEIPKVKKEDKKVDMKAEVEKDKAAIDNIVQKYIKKV
jgi:hypothetical protein